MTTPLKQSEIELWWWECNGTGTSACPDCRNPIICTWHKARLEDLEALIDTACVEAVNKKTDALILQLDRVIDSYSVHQPRGWAKGTIARRGMKNKVHKAVRHFTKPDYAAPKTNQEKSIDND